MLFRSNPLFTEALSQIPGTVSATKPSEFGSVLRPFIARSFATGIGSSFAGIGPMAMAVFPDGSVLASGGANRGSLFRFGVEGGEAINPLITLEQPIFDLALDLPTGSGLASGLWATTGGGPLVRLDPDSGDILAQFGDGYTQALAIDPATGRIYVSSYGGVDIFDPDTETFTHLSDLRVGNLAFAPDGTLWAAAWPSRGDVVRFDDDGEPALMLRLDSPVDSLAFGQSGTRSEERRVGKECRL